MDFPTVTSIMVDDFLKQKGHEPRKVDMSKDEKIEEVKPIAEAEAIDMPAPAPVAKEAPVVAPIHPALQMLADCIKFITDLANDPMALGPYDRERAQVFLVNLNAKL